MFKVNDEAMRYIKGRSDSVVIDVKVRPSLGG